MEKIIYVVIGCDTDPDRDYFLKGTPSEGLGWRGMLEGIPRTKERLRSLNDSEGKPPVITWNLRVDHQIKQIYGSYGAIVEKHAEFFRQLESTGDELAWHPHFWRFDEKRKVWHQDYEDHDWQVLMLKEAHAAFQQVLPGRARAMRTGWSYHTNRTFATVDKLGVEVDISGIPGLRILPRKNGRHLANFYDWSSTPRKPYHPSTADYRRAAIEGESSHSILAAPNLVAQSFWWGMLSGAVLAKKMSDFRQIGYALSRPMFHSSITGKPALFKPILAQMKKDLKRDGNVFYVTLLHPDELTENIHPVYSLENMETNIRSIHRLAESMDAQVSHIRACDIPKYV